VSNCWSSNRHASPLLVCDAKSTCRENKSLSAGSLLNYPLIYYPWNTFLRMASLFQAMESGSFATGGEKYGEVREASLCIWQSRSRNFYYNLKTIGSLRYFGKNSGFAISKSNGCVPKHMTGEQVPFFFWSHGNCPESRDQITLTKNAVLLLLLALLSMGGQTSGPGVENSDTLNMADVLENLEKKSGMFLSHKYFSLVEMPAEYSQHSLCQQVAVLNFDLIFGA
jgi:hypothetical protein